MSDDKKSDDDQKREPIPYRELIRMLEAAQKRKPGLTVREFMRMTFGVEK